MITKDLFKTLSTPAKLAFIARIPVVAGSETAAAPIKVTSFKDDTSGLFVISNKIEHACSPFNGDKMNLIKADTFLELEESNFNEDFVQVAHCGNDQCNVDIYTTAEVAETAKGEDFHCPTCGTVNKMTAAVAAADPVVADADEPAVVPPVEAPAEVPPAVVPPADPVVVPPVEAPATPEGAPNPVPGGEDATASDDDEDEDILADDEDAEDEGDGEVELYNKNGDRVDRDGNLIKVEEDEDDDTVDDFSEVDASVIAAEVAGLNSTIVVDLSTTYDIDTKTIAVQPISANRLAAFGYDSVTAKVVTFGYFNSDKVSEDVAALMHQPKLFATAVTAAIENSDDLVAMGFEPLTATVSITDEVTARIEEETAALDGELNDSMEAFVANYKQSLQTAAAGMNKGLYDSPLVAALTASLSRHGVQNAESIALAAAETASTDYIVAAFAKAEELVAMSDEAREAVAKNVGESNSVLAAASARASTKMPTVATATVELPDILAQDRAEPKPAKQRNLFATSGYGGVVA